ncbi:hypothetical protein RJT34_20080 [Clitoria ternatea]|uniref:Uncharacterized protein n=1 Tax=Clitoria ternatea TaxID=43366 RepID=A0AAN9ISP0_CLITE
MKASPNCKWQQNHSKNLSPNSTSPPDIAPLAASRASCHHQAPHRSRNHYLPLAAAPRLYTSVCGLPSRE